MRDLCNYSVAFLYADSADINYVNNATLFYLQPNLENEYFANENFRQAIAHAIDRDAICSDILKNGSKGAGYLVVSNFAANDEGVDFRDVANKTYQEYDPDEAASYWEKAKVEIGTDSMYISLLYDDTDELPTIVQFVQAGLQANLPGLTVELQAQPTSKARRELMASGDYDVALTRWGSDYNDPATFMDLFKSDGSFNYGKYSNAEYDQLVTDASGKDIMDTNTRFQEYIDAEGILLNEVGIIPMWEVGRAYLIREGAHIDFTVDSGYMFQYANMD